MSDKTVRKNGKSKGANREKATLTQQVLEGLLSDIRQKIIIDNRTQKIAELIEALEGVDYRSDPRLGCGNLGGAQFSDAYRSFTAQYMIALVQEYAENQQSAELLLAAYGLLQGIDFDKLGDRRRKYALLSHYVKRDGGNLGNFIVTDKWFQRLRRDFESPGKDIFNNSRGVENKIIKHIAEKVFEAYKEKENHLGLAESILQGLTDYEGRMSQEIALPIPRFLSEDPETFTFEIAFGSASNITAENDKAPGSLSEPVNNSNGEEAPQTGSNSSLPKIEPDGQRRGETTLPLDEPRYARDLPLSNSMFSGRETELRIIRDRFNAEPPEQVQIISGMPGVGKTQLALQYAHSSSGDYSLIWWVEADSEIAIIESFRSHLPDTKDVSPENVVRKFHEYLQKYPDRWLLVFDNADLSILERFIPNSKLGHILITTRATDRFFGRLPISLDVFPIEDSVAFLKKHIVDEAEKELSQLAMRLGGHPLALSYAATYIERTPGCTSAIYLEELTKRGIQVFELSDDIKLDQYKETVRATFHISLDGLIKAVEATGDEEFSFALLEFIHCSPYFPPDDIDMAVIASFCGCFPLPIRKYLTDNFLRAKLIRSLLSSSLFAHAGAGHQHQIISMHMLLQEIIHDELSEDRRAFWQKMCMTLLSNMDYFADSLDAYKYPVINDDEEVLDRCDAYRNMMRHHSNSMLGDASSEIRESIPPDNYLAYWEKYYRPNADKSSADS